MKDRKLLGALGEDFAASVLYAQGFDILERNYRCPAGEIDLIARGGEQIVFAEVKTRTDILWGRPAESVDRKKQQRIRRAAQWYMSASRTEEAEVSFQVIEILVNQIEDAF